MAEINESDIARFANLFRGNTRSFGRFYPGRKAPTTEHGRYSTNDFVEHIYGRNGIGIVPIMDDGTCYFGAIDIDAHGGLPDIDLVELERNVREKDLPLMVCRSKSGGAHLYLFGAEPINAKLMRIALTKWAMMLGYPGVEIFPKQEHLPTDETGRQQLGNWLNLCYHDAVNGSPLRYGIEGSKKVSLSHFLDLAESKKITASLLVEKSEDDHGGAPPCIQRMISSGVNSGKRNEALYNVCVYLKQAYPETWRDKAYDLNARIFEQPLGYSEAKKTITSVGRREYRYKCGEEPCKSKCDSAVCVTRKFGITGEEHNELRFGDLPEFTDLKKVLTEPVKWELFLDGKPLVLTTEQLMSFRLVRIAAMENQSKILPPMKDEKWHVILNNMIGKIEEVKAPLDASAAGIVMSRLINFINRCDLESDGTDIKDREMILMGGPAVQCHDKLGRVVYFRGSDFVDYLKKNRAEELKGSNLWNAMRKYGVNHTKLRIRSTVTQVWYLPVTEENSIELGEPREIECEF